MALYTLEKLQGRGCLTEKERYTHDGTYDEIAGMLTGLIRHLETEDRKFRP